MSRQPITLDTLGLAISSLRQKGPHPNLANELAIDVVPVVRGLYQAMAAIGEHARPDNWDDAEDPEQRKAWLQFDAALAAFEAGRARVAAPKPTREDADEPPTCPICDFVWSGTRCSACGFVAESASA